MSNAQRRWILVSDGTPQMLYAGQTELDEAEIDELAELGRPVELHDCRALRTLLVPGPNGQISQRDMLSPISVARSGIRVMVKINAYFWPDEEELMYKTFLETLDPVQRSEVAHRAKDAGIVTPDEMSNVEKLGKLHS